MPSELKLNELLLNSFSRSFVWRLFSRCSPVLSKPDPNTLVMIIESSPTNLDPRVGLDAQSERIDNLIFDDLLSRGDDLNVAPGLAERWEIPDPLTYIFHLHSGVKFHDGRPLTSRDVKWTFDSLLTGRIRSTKTANYRFVDRIDAPDDFTVIFHLKEPEAPLLWNLSDGAIGIVPAGSGDEMTRHPMGSGPFKFISAETDKEVIVERNDDYWGEKPKLARVRFAVVPEATTEALELRKGSGDVGINSLTPDMVLTLSREPNLVVERDRGTEVQYLAFNLRDPILKDVRVRQAVAYALDCRPMIDYLWRGQAELKAQRSAAAELGLQRGRTSLRAQPGKSAAIAGRRRLSVGERSAVSHHHENLDQRKHAPDRGRDATAVARGWDRSRHSEL